MEFIQKKISATHTFTFNEEYLNFAYKEKSGQGDFDINYADIPTKASIQIEQNEWLKNVGLLWIAIGILQVGYALYLQAPLSGKGFWIPIGILCLTWAVFTKIKYSVFKTEKGNIFVIHDKKHDDIVAEFKSRKKMQLIKWYGDVNPENDLNTEINKFNWLAEQNVLSRDEADKKIAQAELLIGEHFELPGERLN
ncbi:hypothetical protein J3L16_04740 [Alteromonas sp. 5E99-2]|uniref:hypothetical protein n=1 Tax=Alteromonas sp. 5E99-2 TaxID=2817683 RepID=UPI001A994615|nr:hypothetical protein [Alteromonas sp. 5E99-2]MBO1254994.1 hypothetical protein [Alteromonas sp. 5E99-2]